MCHGSLKPSISRATSLLFTNVFLIRGALFVDRETCLAPKMSITLGAKVLKAEKTHGGLVIQSLHVWSQGCVASVLHALCMHYKLTSSPSCPLYSRSRDSAVRHNHRVV